MEELEEFKSKIPFQLSQKEKIMTINFISFDEDIQCSVLCKNTEIFSVIESKLYKEYPEYNPSENIFIHKNKNINKHLTLEENDIKNNDIIYFKQKQSY